MYRKIAVAVLVGALNAVIVYVNGYALLDLTVDADGTRLIGIKAYHALGTFILGAGPVYLLLRYRLILPILLSGLFTTASLSDHVSGSMESFTPLYLGFWFIFVGILAIVAIVEYGARRGLSFYPPEPLF